MHFSVGSRQIGLSLTSFRIYASLYWQELHGLDPLDEQFSSMRQEAVPAFFAASYSAVLDFFSVSFKISYSSFSDWLFSSSLSFFLSVTSLSNSNFFFSSSETDCVSFIA